MSLIMSLKINNYIILSLLRFFNNRVSLYRVSRKNGTL